VAKLNAEINKAISSEEMREFLVREGAEPSPMTPQAFDALLRKDIERWRKVGATAGIKMD
jgi:tripartite-type tricarboxylate transporter receptor subunit TctC